MRAAISLRVMAKGSVMTLSRLLTIRLVSRSRSEIRGAIAVFGLGDRVTQLPVLGGLEDGLLGPGLGRLDPPQVPAVQTDEALLVVLPGSEAVGLVVQRPQERDDHQQR